MSGTKEKVAETVTVDQARKMAEEAASTAVRLVMESMAEKSGAVDNGDATTALLQGLAKAIAEVGNQGTGKQVVDPAVLAKRTVARNRMIELILEAHQAGIHPEYQLTATVFLADQQIVPIWTDNQRVQHPTRVKWSSVPNEAMIPAEPQNPRDHAGCDAARKIHDAFRESIGKAPGTTAMLMPAGSRGQLATPGGHVFEALPPIPKGYVGGTLEVEPGALPPVETSPTGLEVLGKAPGGRMHRTIDIPVLGSLVEPAKQLVA